MQRTACLIVLAVIVFSPSLATAQAPPPPPTVADTITTFTKGYTGRVRGNVSKVFMGHELNALLRLPSGWMLSGRLAMDEAFYRLQDRRDENKHLGANISKSLGSRINLTGAASDRRFFNRVVTFSGDAQSFKNDRQNVNTKLSYLNRFASGLQANAWGEVGISKSEQTFLDDLYRDGALAGELSYDFRGRISISGRAFIRETDGFALAGRTRHTGLGVAEDSLGTNINLKLSSRSNLNAYYHRFSMTNEFMDLPRGVFLEQQFNENLVRENETQTAEVIRVNLITNPTGRFQVMIGGEHSVRDSRFLNAVKRNSRTVRDGARAVVVFNMNKSRTLRINMDNFEVLHDLGANSLGSYRDKRQSIRATLKYPLTSTLQFQASAGNALIQNFYRDFLVNPRDRDQLAQFINVRILSTPFRKITAQINLEANQTDYVNISGSLSSNNRKETTFNFRPEFTYKITERVELRQQYGLNIEFTDFVFTADENFLDRNFLFSNTVRVKLTPKLSSVMDYTLLLHDRGTYVAPSPEEERLLDINQEDRRDYLKLSFRYQVNRRFALLGAHDYTVRRDVLRGLAPSFKDGGIELGAEGNYNWKAGRTLRFRLVKVNRYGQFNSPAQENYWVADSELVFQF